MRTPLCIPAALAVLAALPSGCSDNNPTLPSGVGRAVIHVSVSPDPVTAVPSATTLGAFSARYTITVSEQAGLGGELVFVHATIFDEATGAAVAFNNYDAADLIVFVGTKRIEGQTSLDISQRTDYVVSGGGQAALLTVAVQFKDDRGSLINQSVLVKVI